jgi:hypothetical protein
MNHFIASSSHHAAAPMAPRGACGNTLKLFASNSGEVPVMALKGAHHEEINGTMRLVLKAKMPWKGTKKNPSWWLQTREGQSQGALQGPRR